MSVFEIIIDHHRAKADNRKKRFVSELKRREMWKKEKKYLEDILIPSLWEAKRIEKKT